jgi:octaprenyl-diphosphate synthase
MTINTLQNNIFSELKQAFYEDLNQVDQVLLKLADAEDTSLINEISMHLMVAGGKRIRPLVCLATARMFGIDNTNHIYLAAAIECIHTATLLHDDVIDRSKTRRGRSTANNIWGDKASILVGDFLFAQAFKLMVTTGSLESLDLLSKTSAVIAESEVSQLQALGNLDFSLDQYLKLINAKTAQLFAAAAATGAISAKSDMVDICAQYGQALGMCFQIIDDILDYAGSTSDFGKKIGNDFFEGKATAPLIFAYKNADAEDKILMNQLFDGRHLDGNFSIMQQLVIKHNGIKESFHLVEFYHSQALYYLAKLPKNQSHLQAIINFAIKREH